MVEPSGWRERLQVLADAFRAENNADCDLHYYIKGDWASLPQRHKEKCLTRLSA